MMRTMSLVQLDAVIAEAGADVPQSGFTKGLLEARGLVASELRWPRFEDDEGLVEEIEDAIAEALAWTSLDIEHVLVANDGAESLAKLTGVDVWTHGNRWRKKNRELTPAMCAWFADYTKGYVTELRRISVEFAGTLPS